MPSGSRRAASAALAAAAAASSSSSAASSSRAGRRALRARPASARAVPSRSLSSLAPVPASSPFAGAVLGAHSSLPPLPQPPQVRQRLIAAELEKQKRKKQAREGLALPSTLLSPVSEQQTASTGQRPRPNRPSRAKEPYIFGSTRPARGRPLRPRSERRLASKMQRQAAKQQAKASTLASQLGVATSKTSPFVRIDRQFKTFKPLTPSLRWVRFTLNPHLSREGPERALTIAKRGTAGRNHHGRVTVRGRGGGHRRRLRLVDFYRWEQGEQDVLRIEYDPGRSAHIALLEHKVTKRRSYILAPDGLRAGDTVRSYRKEGMGGKKSSSSASSNGAGSSEATDSNRSLDLGVFRTQAVRSGNVLPLSLIPIGTMIHAVSLLPTGPARLIRSAGTSGQLVAFSHRKAAPTAAKQDASAAETSSQEGAAAAGTGAAATAEQAAAVDVVVDPTASDSASSRPPTHAQIKLQSGEVRLVPVGCCATIGRVSNIDHEHRRLGKAGRSRWLGRKPKVRGVAMNKTDHPNGGGRGKSKSNKQSMSIYGHYAKFVRTRKPGTRGGNTMVIRERPRRNGKRLGKP